MNGLHRAMTRYSLFAKNVATTKAPSEVVIFPPGRIASTYTDKPAPLMDEEAALRCIAAMSRYGNDIVWDYEHQATGDEKYKAPDGKVPAAGWIKSLRWDAARGLVATVEWTEIGKGYIESKQYRYFSPAFMVEPNPPYRIEEVLSVALTNTPAMLNCKPLAAKRRMALQKSRNQMDQILKLLGLDESATYEQIAGMITDENADDISAFLGCEPDRKAVLAAINKKLTGDETGKMPEAALPEGGEPDVGEGEGVFKRMRAFAAKHSIRAATPDEFYTEIETRLSRETNTKMSIDALKVEFKKATDKIAALEETNERLAFKAVLDKEFPGVVPPAEEEAYFKIWKLDADHSTCKMALKNAKPIANGKSVVKDGTQPADAGSKTPSDIWYAKVKEVADARKCKLAIAIGIAQKEHKELYEAYRTYELSILRQV